MGEKVHIEGVLDITERISSASAVNLGQKILMMEGKFDNYGEKLENAEVLKLAISRLDSELFLLSFGEPAPQLGAGAGVI